MRNKISFKKYSLSQQGFKCLNYNPLTQLIQIDIRDNDGYLHSINGPAALDIELYQQEIYVHYYIRGCKYSKRHWMAQLKEEEFFQE